MACHTGHHEVFWEDLTRQTPKLDCEKSLSAGSLELMAEAVYMSPRLTEPGRCEATRSDRNEDTRSLHIPR